MLKKSCCFTGHRPEKLPWGFDENNAGCRKLKALLFRQIEQLITAFGITHFISGMARGIDIYAAEIVLQLKKAHPVTLECVIPCEEQAVRWPESERERYFSIAAQADRETMLQYHYTQDCYRKRNRYMVDRSDHILAVWDGTSSGTARTIQYACCKGRQILIIDPVRLAVMPRIIA